MSYAPGANWDLEAIFPGGVTSDGFAAAIDSGADELMALVDRLRQLGDLADDLQGWQQILPEWFDVLHRLGDLHALAYCHVSAFADDPVGRTNLGRLDDLSGPIAAGDVLIDAAIGVATDAQIDALATGPLASYRDAFEQTRRAHRLKLDPQLEGLLAETDREALHGWGQLYETVVGRLKIPVDIDGETVERGVAELGADTSSADPDAREMASDAIERGFASIEDVCASCLNALTGARQSRLDRVGARPLEPSLLSNRIDQSVLDAMWAGADTVATDLVRYLDAKAAWLRAQGQRDTNKLRWCDQLAPVGKLPGGSDLSWPAAQDLIVDAFDSFQPELGAFARDLLREGGVESEKRSNKRPGGYCVGFNGARTSRIFMTFGGNLMDAVVLAHELGHAWHNQVLYQAPEGHRMLTMSLAETASTLAESIVRDQIANRLESPEEQLGMLDQELQAATAMVMNIRARFDFELSLYDLRRQGPLNADVLTEQMLAASKRAYHDALEDYQPHFWASKGHFYISHFGFYNWPYTFGFLFSSAVYARARAEGPSFFASIVDLLMRTGYQEAGPLALASIGVDLSDPAFWASAAEPIKARVDRYVDLAGRS